MNIAVNMNLLKGLMIGIRHFEPDEQHPYFEVQIYILLFSINIFFIQESEE